VGGLRHAPAASPPGKTRYPLYSKLGEVNLAPTWIRSPDHQNHFKIQHDIKLYNYLNQLLVQFVCVQMSLLVCLRQEKHVFLVLPAHMKTSCKLLLNTMYNEYSLLGVLHRTDVSAEHTASIFRALNCFSIHLNRFSQQQPTIPSPSEQTPSQTHYIRLYQLPRCFHHHVPTLDSYCRLVTMYQTIRLQTTASGVPVPVPIPAPVPSLSLPCRIPVHIQSLSLQS
jgi:hypothetical protein